jgi:hypothetical protein
LSQEGHRALAEQGGEHAQAVRELKATIGQNQLEFEAALGAKAEHTRQQAGAGEELKGRAEQAEARAREAEAGLQRGAQVREEQERAREELLEQHHKVLASLREEQADKDAALDKQASRHQATLAGLQSRESLLEADQGDYVTAMATAQREVEDKSRSATPSLSPSPSPSPSPAFEHCPNTIITPF